jgi:parvulin-like peptidyl-prolyl isomerase
VAQRHPEFDTLMKEYEDGVLLFKIEQDEVWDKIDVSDSAMVAYYEANKEQYQLKNLVNVQEILVSSERTADSLYTRLKNGEDFGTLAQEYTIRVGYNTKKGVWGQLDPRTHAVTEKAWEMDIDSVSKPFKLPEGWSIVKPLTKQRERLQEYEEVATEVANSYRETASTQREEEWVEGLKKKYGAVITKEFLAEAFRRNPVESNNTK